MVLGLGVELLRLKDAVSLDKIEYLDTLKMNSGMDQAVGTRLSCTNFTIIHFRAINYKDQNMLI